MASMRDELKEFYSEYKAGRVSRAEYDAAEREFFDVMGFYDEYEEEEEMSDREAYLAQFDQNDFI